MNTKNTSNASTAREILMVLAGVVALIAIVIATVSTLIYRFFDRLSEAGRLDALVLLTWGVIVAFVLGIVLGIAYVRGFKLGREHGERTWSAPRSTDRETPATSRAYPLDNAPLDRLPALPRVFDAEEAETLLKYLEDNHA